LIQSFFLAIAVSAYMLVPTWTLVTEEYFYLIIPFCIRRMSSRRLVRFLLLVMVVAPVFRAVLFKYLDVRHGWAELSVYMWPPCRADALALGVLLAIIWQDSELRARLLAHSSAAFWGMFAFSGLAALLQWMADRNFHYCRSLNAGFGRTTIELAYV
jgi:peptidoglycan/LPS O-acetylase OafA/YrhL